MIHVALEGGGGTLARLACVDARLVVVDLFLARQVAGGSWKIAVS